MSRFTTYDVAVRAEATLGEGPTWDGERLLWIDILGARLHTYDPVSGHRTVRVLDQHIGAVKPRAGGGLVLNLRDGVALLDPDDSLRWLHHEPVPGRRANDAGLDITALDVTPAQVAAVQALVDNGSLNDKLARQVFDGLLAGEGTPEEIVAARGLAAALSPRFLRAGRGAAGAGRQAAPAALHRPSGRA